MGDEKAIDQTEVNNDEINEDAPLSDVPGSSPGESEGAESGDEVGEVDIVLSSDDGSQPDQIRIDQIVQRRVNKLNRRNKASSLQTDKKLETLEQENRLLRLSIEQNKESPPATAPDPDKFEDGVSDPLYLRAHDEYTDARVNEAVKKHIPQQIQAPPQQDQSLERKQIKHYERAEALGVTGYEGVEDKAIEIIGTEAANFIIQSNENSHLIFYHLGKNPGKAEYFADLSKTDAGKCVMELGALGADLKVVQPKANLNQAPDPDDELEGSSPAKLSSDDRKLESLRAQAQETGDMTQLMAFKRQLKERVPA